MWHINVFTRVDDQICLPESWYETEYKTYKMRNKRIKNLYLKIDAAIAIRRQTKFVVVRMIERASEQTQGNDERAWQMRNVYCY